MTETGGDVAAIAASGSHLRSSARTATGPVAAAAIARNASTSGPRGATPRGLAKRLDVRSKPDGWFPMATDTARTAGRRSRWLIFPAAGTTATATAGTASPVTTPGASSPSSGFTAARGSTTCGAVTASVKPKSMRCWPSKGASAPSAARMILNMSITIIAPGGCAGYCASTATAASGSSGIVRSSSPVRSRI